MRNLSKAFGKLTILLLLLLAICFFPLSAQAKYGGGTGEPNDPYLICDANQMNAIGADANDWDKHFKLTADIDLSGYTGTEFNTIGYYISSIDNKAFTGVFEGNGHAIFNFSFTSTGRDYIGLFGYVSDPNAEIKDLRLIDPNLDAGIAWNIGPLVGQLSGGTITNCCVDGGSISGVGGLGGLVVVNSGTITDCSSSASISGESGIGGLVASNDGTITNCYSSGDLHGFSDVGGLVAFNGGTISNCYSDANVSEMQIMGGLVGRNDGTITCCYSSGDVSGCMAIGGLVGGNWGIITNCYTATSVSGTDDMGGLVGINSQGTIINCYSIGSVTVRNGLAGLTAYNSGHNATISNCYALGSVSDSYDIGGLVGEDSGGLYTKCFWDNTVNSSLTGIGNTTDPNVIGESTTNMQTQSTFTSAGWDFVNIWDICEGTNYPKFLWQIPIGDFLCPDGVNFFDYSFFAGHWAEDNCGASNDCGGTDLDKLGSVDINDLRIFVDNWLAGL